MPLNPEEEKRFREEIRKKLEEREKREREQKKNAEENKQKQLEERLRARIKEEEEEKFFTERGYVKYVNRYGEVEWRTPQEIEKRKESRRKRRSSSRRRKLKRKRVLLINTALAAGVIFVFIFLYKFNPSTAPRTGSLLVETNVPGASIYIDGKQAGVFTPDTLVDVKSGKHFVTVFKEGYNTFPPLKMIKLKKNKLNRVKFQMQNIVALAVIRVQSNVEDYQLYVDGAPAFVDGRGLAKVPQGYHTFMVVKMGFVTEPSHRRMLVKSGDTTDLEFELVPDSQIGYLQISNNLFRGNIFLDKQFVAMQARGDLLPVKAGTYVVRVRENGYRCEPDSQLINVLPGEREMVVFRIKPVQKKYRINIRSINPGAVVLVDGYFTPYVTPVRGLQISPGLHYINLLSKTGQFAALDKPIKLGPHAQTDYFFEY